MLLLCPERRACKCCPWHPLLPLLLMPGPLLRAQLAAFKGDAAAALAAAALPLRSALQQHLSQHQLRVMARVGGFLTDAAVGVCAPVYGVKTAAGSTAPYVYLLGLPVAVDHSACASRGAGCSLPLQPGDFLGSICGLSGGLPAAPAPAAIKGSAGIGDVRPNGNGTSNCNHDDPDPLAHPGRVLVIVEGTEDAPPKVWATQATGSLQEAAPACWWRVCSCQGLRQATGCCCRARAWWPLKHYKQRAVTAAVPCWCTMVSHTNSSDGAQCAWAPFGVCASPQ